MVGWLLQIGGALELANNTLAQSKDAKGHDKTWSDYNDNLNNGVIQAHQRPILWLLALYHTMVCYIPKKASNILNCLRLPFCERFEFTWK